MWLGLNIGRRLPHNLSVTPCPVFAGAGPTPDGLYANVDSATTLTSGATVFEKLSFRLDDDGRWHLIGYVPRQSQDI